MHTKTPWIHEAGDRYIRQESTGGTVAMVCEDDGHCDRRYRDCMPTEDNAALIVRAVNCHAELVAALTRIANIATLAWTDPPTIRAAFEKIKAESLAAKAKA